MSELILESRLGRAAILTFNRPDKRNALSSELLAELGDRLIALDGDDDVGGVVLTGDDRAFSAGADLGGALEAQSPRATQQMLAHFGRANDAIETLTKPVVAAINGPAAGVGFALACWCDLRFAAEGAKLTTAHGPLGLPAEYGLSWLLPRLIGLGHANDVLISSRKFLAEEALAMGLVNAVLPREALLEHARAWLADVLARVAPSSLTATRHQIYTDLHRTAAESVLDSEQRLEAMMKSDDYREGVAAFVGKRPPAWKRG